MKILKTLTIICIALNFLSCKKQALNLDDLVFNQNQQGNPLIEAWIKTNYLDPYNIEVLYKWDASELNTNNVLVPPAEEHVIPVMDMVKKSWIDVYNSMGNPNFIKENSPKQYLLVGSAEYNSSGGLTTGYAEGGTKIALFRINWFNIHDRPLIKRIIKTVHHEYIHILNQKKRFQDEFAIISEGEYTSTFAQLNDQQARELGFITPYAGSVPGEDFAEMVSVIVTEGRENYEAILSSIQNQAAAARIRAKEAIIVDYYKTYWNIDFNLLTEKTAQALDQISPVELNQYMGSIFSSINFDVRTPSLLGPQAQQAIADTQLAFKNHTTGAPTGRSIHYVNLAFVPGNLTTAQLQFRYSIMHSTSNINGVVNLKVTQDASNKIKFSNPTAGANAASVMNQLAPLLKYLNDRTFQIKFKEGYDKNTVGDNFGGLVVVDNPLEFMYGTLTPPNEFRSIGLNHHNLNMHINDERFWGADAWAMINDVKTPFLPTGSTANLKADMMRFEIGVNTIKLRTKLSQATEWRSYTNTGHNFEIDFDPYTGRLTFSDYSAQDAHAVARSVFVEKLSAYLTARTFNVEFHEQNGLGDAGDRFVKISNVNNPSDYFICQLNTVALHKELVRSVRYFNLPNTVYSTYYNGAIRTVVQNINAVVNSVDHSFSHMNLFLPNETTARFATYFKPPAGTPLQNATIELNMDIDRVKNEIRFTHKSTTGNTAVKDQLNDFIAYFTTRTFRIVYSKGSYYDGSGTEGQLIDISNTANYIVLPF